MGFETDYVALFEERQRVFFEMYGEGEDRDVRTVEAALYELCRSHRTRECSDRRLHVLHSVATRGRVDYHPVTSDLRSRLDDPSNYAIPPGASRGVVGAAMEDDLIELIEIRNRLAIDEGFTSYADLAMWHEGLDMEAVRRLLSGLREEVLPTARQTVEKESMTLESWFDDLERLGGSGPPNLPHAATSVALRLGLDEVADRITWVVRDQPIYGVAFALSIPNDVRILLGRSGSLTALVTAYHELGHALGHAANRSAGILKTWDVTTDEALAEVMEPIANLLTLSDDERDRIVTIEELETARLATSLLFEFDVNEQPERGRELFDRWYGPLAPFEDAAMWARDSFRSEDPFQIQGYLIGRVLADATLAFLTDRFPNDPEAWGRWLVEHYYAPGRGVTLSERIDALEEHRPDELDGVFVV